MIGYRNDIHITCNIKANMSAGEREMLPKENRKIGVSMNKSILDIGTWRQRQAGEMAKEKLFSMKLNFRKSVDIATVAALFNC